MKEKKQIAVIGYYNVLYFINIKSELDRVKIEYMMNRIKAGEKIFMRDIQKWCMAQSLGYKTHFIYRTEILRQYFINHPQSIDKYTFLQNSAFTHWVKEKCSKMC